MRFLVAVLFAVILTFSSLALAQTCPTGKVCVDNADMQTFIAIAKERKCLVETTPTFTADPITIVVDRQGRVYSSGAEPHPYALHLGWCNFAVEAKGEVKTVVAEHDEPTWGFRFRVKATLGVLGTELLVGEHFTNALDGGLLLEPFYFQWLNVHGYVGVRSVGAGLGADLTKNFGLGLGYALTWGGWRSNPFASLYFAFN